MSLLLACNDLEKRYRMRGQSETLQVLKKVSFNLYEGDRLGLVGLNGSGKSTLLKIISGITRPDAGTVSIYKSVQNLSGFDSMLHTDMTGRQNIGFQLGLMNFTKQQITTATDEIAEFSGLGKFIEEPVKNYSSGMMLRLSFSILKQIKPEILLLDEVLSAGDITFKEKVDALMLDYFKNVSGIIMASHQFIEISQYCNKCLVLNKGQVDFFGSVQEALNLYVSHNKTKTILPVENDVIRFDNIQFASHDASFFYSDPVQFSFSFVKKTDTRADVVLYVDTDLVNVLTDCPLYQPRQHIEYEISGNYRLSVTIPAKLLNAGKYHIKLVFGDGEKDIMTLTDLASFTIQPDQWEKGKLWNRNPTHAVRPALQWDVTKINP